MLQWKNVGLDHLSGKKTAHALRRINLTLPSAGLVLITGGAGSGKTALLHLLSGRELPTRGEIHINGENTSRWSESRLSAWRRRTGAAETDLLLPDRTAEENVRLSARLAGWQGSDARRKAAEALALLGLQEFSDALPDELSGEQRRLLALCCALAREPELLVVDEPLDGLGEDTGRTVLSLLRAASNRRLVAVASRSARLFGEETVRVLTLEDGELVSDTDPEEPAAASPGAPPAGISGPGRVAMALGNLGRRRSRTAPRLLGAFAAVLLFCLGFAALSGAEESDRVLQSETLAAYPLILTRESVASGDLDSLSVWLEENMDIHSASLQRSYAITPRIYSSDTSAGAVQVSPEAETGTTLWTELPDGEALQRARYQLVSGRWPARYDEAAVLLDSQGSLDRATLSALGISSETAAAGISYTDLLRMSFRVVLPTSEYVRNVDGTWGYMANDREFMSAMVSRSQPLNVVGILRPIRSGTGDTGVGGAVYMSDLTRWVVSSILSSEIVTRQTAEPGKDVLSGRPFSAGGHETEPEAQRAALRHYATSLRADGQAELYERITGQTVAETAAQDSLLRALDALSDPETAELYAREISDTVAPGTMEDNLRAFGAVAAETVTGLRLYAGTFAYRGTLTRLLGTYAERVSYTDTAREIIDSGAALLENAGRLRPALKICLGVLAALAAGLASALPLLSRRRETAAMRIQGLSGPGAAGILGWESFFLGLLGSVSGVLVALALVRLAGGGLLGSVRWSLDLAAAGIIALAGTAWAALWGALAASGVSSGSPETAFRRAEN